MSKYTKTDDVDADMLAAPWDTLRTCLAQENLLMALFTKCFHWTYKITRKTHNFFNIKYQSAYMLVVGLFALLALKVVPSNQSSKILPQETGKIFCSDIGCKK